MKNIRISVAVASYNGEKYIKEQLDSILKNLSKEDEVVVSDDGSTDRTKEILKEYEAGETLKDTSMPCGKKGEIPVKVIDGPGKGIKANINEALLHCRGKYIFLADQDDVWQENKVETVMHYLGKEGCRVVCHDAQVMNQDLSETIMPSFFAYRGSKPGFLNNLLKNRYMGCCMAFERNLLPYVLPIPEEIEMHDQWIGMISDMLGKNSLFIPEKLLLYRRHDSNVSDFSHGTVFQMICRRLVLLRAICRRRKLWKT